MGWLHPYSYPTGAIPRGTGAAAGVEQSQPWNTMEQVRECGSVAFDGSDEWELCLSVTSLTLTNACSRMAHSARYTMAPQEQPESVVPHGPSKQHTNFILDGPGWG
jgi:hypothetical protein